MSTQAIMRVKDVTKKFGGLTAVNRVSFDVEEGQILGLIGANGAGKTTLFNMLTGMFGVTSGNVFYRGEDITNMPCNKICKKGIARTFQIVKPFTSLTALENVMVGSFSHTSNIAHARETARELIEMVGLKERMDVDGEYLNLPERKKLELARAMATRPKLLLLDEVIAGMGPTQSEEIIGLIRRINQKGTTIILIEHVMKAVMNLCSHVCVLDQGELIASGTPEAVVNDPKVIKSYLGEKKHVAES